jgi:hypothetical protein
MREVGADHDQGFLTPPQAIQDLGDEAPGDAREVAAVGARCGVLVHGSHDKQGAGSRDPILALRLGGAGDGFS